MYNENELIKIISKIREPYELLINFRIVKEHQLFKEHFPMFPVLPASYLLSFLINQCEVENYPISFLNSVSLINALTPENEYKVKIKSHEQEIKFFIIKTHDMMRVASGIFLKKLAS
jgi:hypothetical protein